MGLCSSNDSNITIPPAPPVPAVLPRKLTRDPVPSPRAVPSPRSLSNEQFQESLNEMKKLRKPIHDKKENEDLHAEGKAVQCTECGHVMPHLTTRKCTCHSVVCKYRNPQSSCTIFRKISRI